MNDEYADVINIATEIIKRTIDPVLGCRSIVAALCASDPSISDSQAFLTFRGFESETDHFPMGDVRSRYDVQFLENLDKERIAYVSSCESDIRAACHELIEILKAMS
jgi:hypothetical protein